MTTVICHKEIRRARRSDISFYPHANDACRKPKPRGAGGGPRPCWTDEQARVDSRDVSETERAFRLAPRKRAFRILDRFRPSDASPTRPQWNTHPALRPWGGGCVLPVRPGSGGGPAPPRALCGWRRRGRLRYGHSRAGPLRDRGRPSRLEGGRRAPTRDGLTVVMYTCRLRAGAHPPHDRLPTARPGWLPRRSRDGRAGAPALKASIPRPGSCARPDCSRRGYAAEARSCRNRDRCGRTRARRTARVQRASHRPRTRPGLSLGHRM